MDESRDCVLDPLAGQIVADEERHAILIVESVLAAQARAFVFGGRA